MLIINATELQGCVFTRDINKAILISDAMESGAIQINSAPARGPDHFPFQVTYNSLETCQAIFNLCCVWISSVEGIIERKIRNKGESARGKKRRREISFTNLFDFLFPT